MSNILRFIFMLFTISILFFAGCSSGSSTANPLLHDIWALESIEGEKIIIDETVKNLPVIEIYIKEERVHGNTSCNTIDGKVEVDKNNIVFSEIITTEMACPGDIESRFLFALGKVNNYKIKKLKLYLYDNDKELLV
ncbi:MAG: META domain-containing protein, partial [Ignavibacteriaceae bacterium]